MLYLQAINSLPLTAVREESWSLVAQPSLILVFDHLWYAKTEVYFLHTASDQILEPGMAWILTTLNWMKNTLHTSFTLHV